MTPAGWIPERSEIIYIQHSPSTEDELEPSAKTLCRLI